MAKMENIRKTQRTMMSKLKMPIIDSRRDVTMIFIY